MTASLAGKSPQEIHYLATMARGCLLIEGAKRWGAVTVPDFPVDVRRCVDVLAVAQEWGIVLTDREAQEAARQLVAQWEAL